MKVYPDKLDGHLAGSMGRMYWVSGDEPLLVQEASDAIRAAARRAGADERVVYHVERGFDWQEVLGESDALSLFASRKLLELRLASAKPGDKGSKALQSLAERADDNIILITSPRLDAASQKTKWFKTVEAQGISVQVWPLAPKDLPGWIHKRMAGRGLKANRATINALARKIEGNLLAAVQEIDRLALQALDGAITEDMIEAAVTDQARFDVYQWLDAALAGQTSRSLRMLRALEAEGVDAVVIASALTREVRQLAQMSTEANASSVDEVIRRYRIWPKRQPLIAKALKRSPSSHYVSLLPLLSELDRQAKGQAEGNPWQRLSDLNLKVASAS